MIRDNMYFSQLDMLWKLFSEVPDATAYIRGSNKYPRIKGVAQFYQLPHGVLMVVEVMGLPTTMEPCTGGVHAVHIHGGAECTGNEVDPFANAGTHYNPSTCDHPHHAGDLPPIFENNGYGMMAFFTNRFQVKEVLGKTIVVHEDSDDFHTQPTGNAGAKIACGEIVAVRIQR